MTEIPVIDINDNSDKQLKVTGSFDGDGRNRIISAHPTLIKHGLIKFVEHRKSTGAVRLFSTEERDDRGQFGPFANRFTRYHKTCEVVPRHD